MSQFEQPWTRRDEGKAGAWSDFRKAKRNSGGNGVSRKPRIAMYSHDTMGVGHMRRNLLIAQAITQSAVDATVLMIAGAREASAFAIPAAVDCLTLPSLYKDSSGSYHAGRLGVSFEEAIRLRRASILAAVKAFRPDVFIVDKVPQGAAGELRPTLELLRSRRRTRCVLGLREVLDDKATVAREWQAADTEQVINDFFDAVWIYGDRRIFDPIAEYGIGAQVAAKTRFTGYLNQSERSALNQDAVELERVRGLSDPAFVLCVVGGGQDGGPLARTFLDTVSAGGMPSVLVTGPFMPQHDKCELMRRGRRCPNLRVIEFVTEADQLVRKAERVIAMGGYNTICSILSFDKPALVVPRIRPRREQLIRAQRLRELGLIDMLHPGELSAEAITAWLARKGGPTRRTQVDLNGFTNIQQLLRQLLADSSGSKSSACHTEDAQHVAH